MEETGVKVPNEFVLHTRHQLKKQKNPKKTSMARLLCRWLACYWNLLHTDMSQKLMVREAMVENWKRRQEKVTVSGPPTEKGRLVYILLTQTHRTLTLFPKAFHLTFTHTVLLLRGLSGQSTRGDAPNKKNIQQNLIISCVKQTQWGSTGCFFVL